ncbi:riboflavin synthase subunit alpha [Pantoea sp. SoEX]|uniref:riboflavin synthase subunit alpha n=1 Tax=Pantoea sp. SoEX TaxID=2576763 RepID=UPI00351B4B80
MVNGCCLTVASIDDVFVSFDVINETLRISNLNNLCQGDMVNIERAAKINNEVGGHLMSGHVMTTAKIHEINKSDNSYVLWLKIKDVDKMKYIFHKGFIGIDGISLTVGNIFERFFCIFLIPETLNRTTIGQKSLGYCTNIEVDSNTQVVVHTVERLLSLKKMLL